MIILDYPGGLSGITSVLERRHKAARGPESGKETERSRLEAASLALKEGGQQPGNTEVSRSWKGKGTDSLLEPPEGIAVLLTPGCWDF